ncbi:cytochrome c [Nitrosomonas sp. HPC101]|uniref:c-type cytochrome n=1 Tax=Nitrosomonas sp. HPC101 TaxID=1658667 RepID=UPI00136C06E1|nr:cytochrome c [Nitrosomonas sp. HPC101]MXS85095.1 cytochrome c [Nitrosomonas sp. HPC101]
MKAVLPVVLPCLLLFALSGCIRSNDYMPSSEATGEKIFKEACVQCHTPVSGNVMVLKSEMANADAIMERVKNGKGIRMPAFPNLTGDSAQRLAEYVLENSVAR